MKKRIKELLDTLPYLRTLRKEIKSLTDELAVYKTNYPPGHFYSPIVTYEKVQKRAHEIFTIKTDVIPGIDLNKVEQIELLNNLKEIYSDVPFTKGRTQKFRYYFDNTYYSYSDAIFLHLIIRYFRPESIIEIGSGFSSAVMLDTNENYFDSQINLTFIDPNPDRLFSLFRQSDEDKHRVVIQNLEDIDLEFFDGLVENDILFVDSTHVSKTGSDVNRILFEVLPRLKKGVLVHFHDIFYPFEYPEEWVKNWKGFGWNEGYILKAFLMYNNQFKIIMFNTFLEHFERDWFIENMPDCLKNEGGSLWLQRL